MTDFDFADDNFFTETLDALIEIDTKIDKHTILIVDDEENNLKLLKRTLHKDYNILEASDGLDALNVVRNNGYIISAVLTDQKMPNLEGIAFLKKITNMYPNMIKIIITAYTDPDEIAEAINICNISQYIIKPYQPEDIKSVLKEAIKKFELSNKNSLLLKDLKELFYKTIKSISFALDAKDPYTHGHSMRVTLYSLVLARAMNLDEKLLEEIETAGLLHDIGKIGIPQNILCKAGKLTDEEFEIMKTHCVHGQKMIKNIKKLEIISEWLKTHHERWDGKGYPIGLKSKDIPISSRIIAIADTYDAMTSTRPYRNALTHEIAISEIEKCSGTQFDPTLAKLFIEHEKEIE